MMAACHPAQPIEGKCLCDLDTPILAFQYVKVCIVGHQIVSLTNNGTGQACPEPCRRDEIVVRIDCDDRLHVRGLDFHIGSQITQFDQQAIFVLITNSSG